MRAGQPLAVTLTCPDCLEKRTIFLESNREIRVRQYVCECPACLEKTLPYLPYFPIGFAEPPETERPIPKALGAA